ncbi:Aste57867_12354 [Aphanomyces stellatus]|uniref:Aste57867_12354 protein n=1 Tax=Aphanomyces stellatus TaxID=120398 RepID=A0A485KVY8_9STRA|nr:hypothetical protein As57867_012308 [Aphanomyces stellatus]VFT89206.1 Aste57867_12354 [Aphanomyces stellatus]
MLVHVAPAAGSKLPKRPLVVTYLGRLRRFIFGFALFKHVVCAFYLAAEVVIFLNMDATQTRSAHAFALPVVIVVYLCLAAVHVLSLLYYLGDAVGLVRLSVHFHSPRSFAWLVHWATYKPALAAYNVFELGCQTFEAFEFASMVVDRRLVATYVVLVALHAIVAPTVVCLHHSTSRLLLLNWFSSLLSFLVSCVLHIVGLVVPLLHYFLVDFTINRDPAWLTRNVLYARYNFVTSPVDFIAKIMIQLGSLVSIWRLLASLHVAKTLQSQGRRLSTALLHRPIDTRRLKLYHVCSTLWGLALLVSLGHAFYGRQSCPSTCAAAAAPLWTTACQCMYVHVNCYTLGHDDVDAALDAHVVGPRVFALVVSRCDLPDGIGNATLNQFQSLYFVKLIFTHTKTWSAQLPPSTYAVVLEYAAFTSLPAILRENLGPYLSVLGFVSLPMTSFEIPDHAWVNVTRLTVTNLSLAALPPNVAMLPLVHLLADRNQLTNVSTQVLQMPSLNYLDASANNLHEGPWSLLTTMPHSTLLLCGNPLSGPPDSIGPALRQVYVAEAAAACSPLCAPYCFPYLVGDHDCQLACFNAACNFDGGDCDDFGFDRPD